MSKMLLVDTWTTVHKRTLFRDQNEIALLSKKVSISQRREVTTSFKNLCQGEMYLFIQHMQMPSWEKIENPSKIIHLQGLLVKHFYFPSVIFPATMTSWVLKEVKVTYVMENTVEKIAILLFFYFFVRSPLHTHKGVFRCLPMLHSIYEYIKNVFKVWIDDLRKAKTKHKAGKKLHLMLLWCWRGLLVIWGTLHVIKFEDVLSIEFADNIKAWWKDLCFKQFN